MFSELLLLVLFLALLSKSASIVVENAEKLSVFFGISTLTIGMLLVAVSTSLPELAVSIASSSAKESSIAAGNVFGSNITNILLLLGIAAFLYGFQVPKENMQDIALVLLTTTIISAYILLHSEISGTALGFIEGVILILVFLWYANRMLKQKKFTSHHTSGERMSRQEGLKAFIFFSVGILGVLISSNLVVDSAVSLAEVASLAKSFVGATIIAVGTSLPEISIGLQAIKRKQYGLAIGDAIGANMSTMTLALGAASVVFPVTVQLSIFIVALIFAIVANFIFLYFALSNRVFTRTRGLIMMVLYFLYLFTIFTLQLREVL
ncbi:MAG: sodium:calcium antiporter [Candidatus Anstonellaceae archaeon]